MGLFDCEAIDLRHYIFDNSANLVGTMTKYKEVDYKGGKSHWPLWAIPFLIAILLLLIGVFILLTLGVKHHCLFFDCEQPIDKVISSSDELPRNEDVVLGDDEISIHGELIFEEGAPDSLPPNSHLRVKFEDVSMMDAPSVLLGETMVDLSSYDKAKNLKYEIKSKRPGLGGSYSVSATLNVGWKANKEAWIKPGDYMTDTHYGVRIEDKKQDYRRDITLVKY